MKQNINHKDINQTTLLALIYSKGTTVYKGPYNSAYELCVDDRRLTTIFTVNRTLFFFYSITVNRAPFPVRSPKKIYKILKQLYNIKQRETQRSHLSQHLSDLNQNNIERNNHE